jgi:hypothetical protein
MRVIVMVEDPKGWRTQTHLSLTPIQNGSLNTGLALLELDSEKLPKLVVAAETAIFKRLQAIAQSSDHQPERQAIEDALATLRVLKRNNLGFPDWGKK